MKVVAIARKKEYSIGGNIEIKTAELVSHSDSNNELVGYSLNLELEVNCEIEGVRIEKYTIRNSHKLQNEFEKLNTNLQNGTGKCND